MDENKKLENDLISRSWYYFRMGWGLYFSLIIAAINTLTVTFYLAIENYPVLKSIFPTFEIYIAVFVLIGFPLLVAIGYGHFKRTKARKAEVDIELETDPYKLRTLVNSDIILNLYLKYYSIFLHRYNDNITEQERSNSFEFLNQIQSFVKDRKLLSKHDTNFIEDIDTFQKSKNSNQRLRS
jgi:hypothetical protein